MSTARAVPIDRRHRRMLIALLGLAALAVMGLMGYLIWSGYQEAMSGAQTTTRNYAAILEARLDATLRRADAILLERVRRVPVSALSKQAVPRYAREIDAFLDSHMAYFKELAGVRVFDANGDMLYTSASASTPRTHVADRDYFYLLRDDPQAALVFSEVAISRATGRPSIAVARALRDDLGVFRGIVSAVIELDYFRQLFQSMDLGTQGFINLVRSDDFRMVMRYPQVAGEFNRTLPPGAAMRNAISAGNKQATLAFTSARTGIRSIGSFRALEDYPFYVVAALAREDVLAGWRAGAQVVGAAGLLLLLLLAAPLYRLWRVEVREARAMADLVESEERFRTLFEQAAVGVALTESATCRFVRVNQKFADFLGYNHAEMLQQTFRDFTYPDDLGADMALLQRLRAGELSQYSLEKRYIRKDSNVVWGQLTVSPIRKADGSFDYHVAVVTDITERTRAEQALQESEARFRRLTELSSDWYWEQDENYRYLDTSVAALERLGLDREERIGKTRWEIPSVGVSEVQWAAHRADLDARRTFRGFELGRVNRDGQVVWGSISGAPIYDAQGNFKGYGGVGTNITARKRMEASLRDSHEVYQDILATSLDGFLRLDADGRLIEVNATYLRQSGYAREELLGKRIGDLNCYGDEAVARNMRRVRETGSDQFESTHRRKDGSIWQVEVSTIYREARGGEFFAFLRDITERKAVEQASARLAAIVDYSNDAIISRGLDRRILTWNAAAERLFGYTASEAIGRVVSFIVPPDREEEAAQIRTLLGEDKPVPPYDSVRLTKDGRRIDVSATQSPIKDANGKIIGGSVTFRDISARKRMEAELVAARRAAEEASLAKTRFLAAASHDLRQPIQAINLFLDALNRTALSEGQKEISDYLSLAVHSLGELLDGLLDISKLDAGIVAPRLEFTDSENALRRIEAEFAPVMPERNLHFKRVSRRQGLVLHTDPDLLLRILRNIVGNAVKYTEHGGILVGARRRGDRGVIQVWDTGIGVAPVHMSHLFEEYFQIGNRERDKTKGLGLGLAIVRRLAKLIDGEVTCRSRPGRGTVFEISLPLAQGPGKAGPRPRASENSGDSPGFTGRRIVVIEDDVLVAKAIEQSLGALGMSVTAYNDAQDALASLEIADADFYISDLRLPGRIDGVQLLNAIQQRSARPISAVLLTGDTSPNQIDRSASSNWNVLFKPVDLSKLLSAMSATTGHGSESREHQP